MMYRKSIFFGLSVILYLCDLVSPQLFCVSGSCLCPPKTKDDPEDNDLVVNAERDIKATGNDLDDSFEKLIKDAGYTVEAHEIQTADGYLLTYYRIPHGKVPGPPGEPVLLQHGALCSSAGWVLSSDSIAFALADAGYDVWLGNARGNTYSRKHIKLNPDKDSQFWDFSFHEMGYYDLPASIDYILQTTGKSNLFYIGHSMGTTMYFVLGTTRPEYMPKIKASVIMAPFIFPYNVRSNFDKFLPITGFLAHCLTTFNELFTLKGPLKWSMKHICENRYLQYACVGSLFGTAGYDSEQFGQEVRKKIFRYLPAGLARKALQHSLQIRNADLGFRMFDYGDKDDGNKLMYGSDSAPKYDMKELTAPMFIYYGENDLLVAPEDAKFTMENLPKNTVVELKKVPFKKFSHVDFMWAKDGKALLYNDVIKNLQSIDKTTAGDR